MICVSNSFAVEFNFQFNVNIEKSVWITTGLVSLAKFHDMLLENV